MRAACTVAIYAHAADPILKAATHAADPIPKAATHAADPIPKAVTAYLVPGEWQLGSTQHRPMSNLG